MASLHNQIESFYASTDSSDIKKFGQSIFSIVPSVTFVDLLDVLDIIQSSLEHLIDYPLTDSELVLTLGPPRVDMSLLIFQHFFQKEEFFPWMQEQESNCEYLCSVLKNV